MLFYFKFETYFFFWSKVTHWASPPPPPAAFPSGLCFLRKTHHGQPAFISPSNSSSLGWSHLVITDGYHWRQWESGDLLRFSAIPCVCCISPNNIPSLLTNKAQPPNLFGELTLIPQKSMIKKTSAFGSEWIHVTLLWRKPNVYIFICWYFN